MHLRRPRPAKPSMTDILVLYYSRHGATRKL
ncbi:MAG TPA: NAD(P)H-quinone oxidoreductase, partial [Cupriavidus sp.]|nr:NAD(P)H-quinone oxidoreductase [Cupriavidus sp.]